MNVTHPRYSVLVERFWKGIIKMDHCWIWTRATNGRAGIINCSPFGHVLVTRLSWIIHRGPIPKGMFVLHNCPGGDNPRCVNPKHLWLGTQADNVLDLIKKGRRPHDYAKGEKNGRAKLTNRDVLTIR